MSARARSKNILNTRGETRPTKRKAEEAPSPRFETLSASKPGRIVSEGERLRRPLLAAFLVVATFGASRAWQTWERSRWLDTAPIGQLSAQASLHPDDVEIFTHLGMKAREAEQWPRAAKAFQHAAELAPDRVDVWVGWARAIYEVGGFRPANAILTSYIQTHPKESRAYLERASLERLGSHADLAWTDADRAAQLDATNGEAWSMRGDLCMDKGIPGEGEVSYRKAMAIMPSSPWPYVGLFQVYIAEKKYPEALTMARYIAKRFPTVPEANLYLGEALTENADQPADYDAARVALAVAEKHMSDLRTMDQFALLVLQARTYFKQARWSEALPYLQKAEKHVPDNPDMLFLLGRTYRALGDTARADVTMQRHKTVYQQTEAVRQLMAKVNDKPNDARARLDLARWYVAHGVPANAISQYEDMIERGLAVETAQREMAAIEGPHAAR